MVMSVFKCRPTRRKSVQDRRKADVEKGCAMIAEVYIQYLQESIDRWLPQLSSPTSSPPSFPPGVLYSVLYYFQIVSEAQPQSIIKSLYPINNY